MRTLLAMPLLTTLLPTVALALVACGPGAQNVDAGPDSGTAPPCLARPSGGLWASFLPPGASGPGAATFQLHILGTEAVEQALTAWRTHATSAFPIGPLRCAAPVGWNCGWSWHLAAGATTIVESATELCDAAAPASDEECVALVALTGGTWCPWGATFVGLRDCRVDASCPLVPR